MRTLFEQCQRDPRRDHVTVTLSSCTRTCLWVTCPYCDLYKPLPDAEEARIRRGAVGPAAVREQLERGVASSALPGQVTPYLGPYLAPI